VEKTIDVTDATAEDGLWYIRRLAACHAGVRLYLSQQEEQARELAELRKDLAAIATTVERLRSELARVLGVAMCRGVHLGYCEADDDYRLRWAELTGRGWVDAESSDVMTDTDDAPDPFERLTSAEG